MLKQRKRRTNRLKGRKIDTIQVVIQAKEVAVIGKQRKKITAESRKNVSNNVFYIEYQRKYFLVDFKILDLSILKDLIKDMIIYRY